MFVVRNQENISNWIAVSLQEAEMENLLKQVSQLREEKEELNVMLEKMER